MIENIKWLWCHLKKIWNAPDEKSMLLHKKIAQYEAKKYLEKRSKDFIDYFGP